MVQHSQFISYKKHLESRYLRLMERSEAYRYIDETISDIAAFKAMKINEKLNQMHYLNRELFNSFS